MAAEPDTTPPRPDDVLVDIARYVAETTITSDEAYDTARCCLIDALGCTVLALGFPECARWLGPVVPGTVVLHGARVPGTRYEFAPVQAAFDIGTMIRWPDFKEPDWPRMGSPLRQPGRHCGRR